METGHAKGVDGQPFANEIRHVGPINHLSIAHKKREGNLGRICGESPYLVMWITLASSTPWRGFWEFYTSCSTAALERNGQWWEWNDGRMPLKAEPWETIPQKDSATPLEGWMGWVPDPEGQEGEAVSLEVPNVWDYLLEGLRGQKIEPQQFTFALET